MTSTTRVWWVDLIRGIACLSMPIFHVVYNLHSYGFTDVAYNKMLFWKVWQTTGLSTFIFVSGMAFILSTKKGIRWPRLTRRVLKLGALALLITASTYIAMPSNFVRFGVLHFFTLTILLAPLCYRYPLFNLIVGIVIIAFYQWMGKPGLWPESWLYITGMMSERPRSMDYVPLIPWFGVFLIGLSFGAYIDQTQQRRHPSRWMRPIIWLGQHSLSFYFIHQALIYAVMIGVKQWLL